ncbi:hypothetical protein A3B45_00585 [Candidatus Daviesbacteria bacterium RIFCSPLOWO2_01_FULL_39_12]|uniref:Uncharacterized protein n=1 Tax=Candidatus Daviesbacteria bacterium RIFCSPLOWO2_01_FULL_39_12 TaxID=1797785 RepID=A0A1F5KMH7_9BACT|nr:MAG: hypothetical protein A3D79_02300 [Candidatus Daviesbacteria bacterium RIFCSPHIGHO2_02_FULL_39_8]OGE42137.1 MAG: hypothetical protein A3B45_00585 [Candidatus Daviesbacteria bacterium RIFCSPLOWO2_01_FULL_39_12]
MVCQKGKENMNKAQIKQLDKKIDKILNFRKKIPIFPIMGGASHNSSALRVATRGVTPEESRIAQAKGLPCPILIDLSREKEFLEYLKDEM